MPIAHRTMLTAHLVSIIWQNYSIILGLGSWGARRRACARLGAGQTGGGWLRWSKPILACVYAPPFSLRCGCRRACRAANAPSLRVFSARAHPFPTRTGSASRMMKLARRPILLISRCRSSAAAWQVATRQYGRGSCALSALLHRGKAGRRWGTDYLVSLGRCPKALKRWRARRDSNS